MKARFPGTGVLISAVLLMLSACGGGGSTGTNNGGGGGVTSPSALALTHLSPSRVTTGVPQGSLLLTGTNFTSASVVLFDGALANANVQNSSSIELILDVSVSSVAGAHTVQVSDPTNGMSNVLTYDVYDPQPGPLPFAGQESLASIRNVVGSGTLADLNGDGRSDLVTYETPAGAASAQLTIRFGNADGTFSAPVSANVTLSGGEPTQVLAGDLNGDGRIDLVAIYTGSYLALLNDGFGHFTESGSGSLPGSGSFGRGVVGDFNGDGKLDFIIDTGNLPPLAVLFGHGDGTFTPATLLGSGANKAARVIAADLNGDGVTDVIYAVFDNTGNDTVQLHTLLFHADSSSTDSVTSGVIGPSWSFAIGDFNLDRVPDLFVVDGSGTGQALAGNGDGTFAPLGTPVSASDLFLVTPPFVVGDFDNDGNMDLATRLTTIGPDVILFLWGDSRGNFTRQIIASDQSFFLSTGDINGDGLTDILAVASEGFGYQNVILGRLDRNYPTSKLLPNAPRGALSSGNVFNDGSHDILVSGIGDCTTASGTAGVIYHFQPNGAPVAKGTAPACASVLADLNGDGIADLVGIDQNTLFIWKGDGTGSFQPVAQVPITGAQVIEDLVFRDMDGDGHSDIVLAGSILYGNGNFQFDSVAVPSTLNQRFLVGDFDGDHVPDIMISGGVLFGQAATRTFTSPTGSAPACWSGFLISPAIGDLNGDGKDDVVCGASTAPLLVIYVGAGRTGLLQDQTLAVPGDTTTVSSVSLGDFNADGRLDIAVGTLGPDDVVLFTANAQGEYQMSSYAIGVQPIGSIVGDFNHDGAPDLAFVDFGFDFKPNAIEVLLHQ